MIDICKIRSFLQRKIENRELKAFCVETGLDHNWTYRVGTGLIKLDGYARVKANLELLSNAIQTHPEQHDTVHSNPTPINDDEEMLKQ
ncbi:hypothetical protein J8Z24_18295 [Pseudoalteromonas sp. SCSIO 43201]|uniref:hypothetical protein n=1 Tax=Pseudoalteromonas sp. SCSIO 43201 TaxID=2822842 RepID=UPI002074DC3E|nr:hypothetical protein [Pseudoalteromonas sp. SCSIO 43201]USD30912.1 hypothetical protein J8Z24_18295 [Pseudoalteromonas sp. SCSIO 43201]